eukprot:scaffold2752_cov393-Prasinococcus_capsulatus_cf.AAC.26
MSVLPASRNCFRVGMTLGLPISVSANSFKAIPNAVSEVFAGRRLPSVSLTFCISLMVRTRSRTADR